MSGKILYLPVATLPPEEIKLPPDPLAGCRLWCDSTESRRWNALSVAGCAGATSPKERGKALRAFGAALAGAAYVAACVLWPVALWAAPVAVAVGVAAYGSYYF